MQSPLAPIQTAINPQASNSRTPATTAALAISLPALPAAAPPAAASKAGRPPKIPTNFAASPSLLTVSPTATPISGHAIPAQSQRLRLPTLVIPFSSASHLESPDDAVHSGVSVPPTLGSFLRSSV